MSLVNTPPMNQIRDVNYFSIDLELNNKNDGTTPKIIQVGVCVGSPVRPKELKTYSWYINPEEPITPFITQLTGITDEIIQEKAVPHKVVAQELGDIIKENNCFTNPICWGGSGFSSDASELKDEFRQRNIDFPFFGRRIFDVKTIYVFQQMVKGKSPSGGLRKSMISYGLDFVGQSHRAEVDAENTLRFFFHFLNTERQIQEAIQVLRDS
jgi:inhibitor of KinA sporulation pathway (predicted exonuclease)